MNSSYIRRPPFDDETMREIDQARARLEAYRLKGRPYPVLKEETEQPIQPEIKVEAPITRRLNQLEGNLISLRDTLKQHVNEAKGKKKVSKYD